MNKPTSIYLDLIRFLAAFVVFASHAAGERLTGGLFWQIGPYGAEAVDVFFVLSGFVIAYVGDTREHDWMEYAVSRCARIYSVAIPALLVTFFLRARNAAIPALCLNTARITHFESRSFGGRMTPRKLYYISRNKLLLWEMHDRSVRGLRQVVRELYLQAAKQSNSPIRWLFSEQPGARAMRAGVFDYCRRRFGVAPDRSVY